jgi:hypothetical protein
MVHVGGNVQVLAQLLVKPGAAALYSRITWALGRGVGEYLLQQADWMLQDVETLLGASPLSRVRRPVLLSVHIDMQLCHKMYDWWNRSDKCLHR